LRNGAKDNLNLDLLQVAFTQLNDLVESFLVNFRLGLSERQIVALDHRAAYRPFPRAVPLDTFLERNIKKEDNAGDLIVPCQLEEFSAVGRRKRSGIHDAEPVQPQSQLRQVADKCERLGLKTLVALVVAHAPPRPVRRDNLRGAEMTLRKG